MLLSIDGNAVRALDGERYDAEMPRNDHDGAT
jgi:hypothetical protein